jgi:hypothetical protein
MLCPSSLLSASLTLESRVRIWAQGGRNGGGWDVRSMGWEERISKVWRYEGRGGESADVLGG